MLSRLYIRNYAIIRELDITFSDGLNIITGETGAGKSILMGALNLVLGERADKHVLYDSNKKCIVEAVFSNVKNSKIIELVEDWDAEDNEELILRRELQANGKSRSFINDSPVTLTEIKKLGAHLVDLHQQFDTSALAGEQFQTDVLDAMAGTLDEALKLNEAYSEFAQQKKVLEQKRKSICRCHKSTRLPAVFI